MLHVSKEIIPDISRPRIIHDYATKYESRPAASMIKVSVTADIVRNLMYLNIRAVTIPKTNPIATETTASEKNWARIKKGVEVENSILWSAKTVLKSTMETISLNTPSPKIQEYSLG